MVKNHGIRYFPIGLSASVMGLAVVTMAVKHWQTLYGWHHLSSTILLSLTTFLFIVNSCILIYRLFRYSEDVKADFNHPVKLNFFAAIYISMLLLAIVFLYISNMVYIIFFFFGVIYYINYNLFF